MGVPTCPGCGRTFSLRATDVLRFVRQCDVVRAGDVAEHFAVAHHRAAGMLCRLTERGLIARVGQGRYTSDLERGRQALLEQLNRLTPA